MQENKENYICPKKSFFVHFIQQKPPNNTFISATPRRGVADLKYNMVEVNNDLHRR